MNAYVCVCMYDKHIAVATKPLAPFVRVCACVCVLVCVCAFCVGTCNKYIPTGFTMVKYLNWNDTPMIITIITETSEEALSMSTTESQ